MDNFLELSKQKGYEIGGLTIGDCIDLAMAMNCSVGEVAVAEAMAENKMTREQVAQSLSDAFVHNLYAVQIGLTSGSSFLLGKLGKELADSTAVLNADPFLDKAVRYTLAAQVGNHSVGLQPCAGTGDSCTLTGLLRALQETITDERKITNLTALMLKIATIFRAGKTTTGCNMEGLGAGAAATAAVVTEMIGGTPEQVGKAMVLAVSPTIGSPCTPRVMVSGLCSTHIGGGVMIGCLAANLMVKTSLPVTVPVDVMVSMAAAVHLVSAKHIVPVVVHYMEPFFKTNEAVEEYISPAVKSKDAERVAETLTLSKQEARELAAKANSIIKPFSDAVVGGSSQAVGSPTNAARIAHALSRGEVTGVKIELYPELFARRGITVPGMLMAAVFGSRTDDAEMYREIMGRVRQDKLKIEVYEVDGPQLQQVTVYAKERNGKVVSYNRGGARIVLKDAEPSLEEALAEARKLNIYVVD